MVLYVINIKLSIMTRFVIIQLNNIKNLLSVCHKFILFAIGSLKKKSCRAAGGRRRRAAAALSPLRCMSLYIYYRINYTVKLHQTEQHIQDFIQELLILSVVMKGDRLHFLMKSVENVADDMYCNFQGILVLFSFKQSYALTMQ